MPSKEQEKDLVSPLTFKQGEKGAFDKNPTKVFDFVNFEKNKNDFHWIESDEPHSTRRKEILKMHPEIKELFGVEPLTFWIVLILVLSQLWIASWITQCSTLLYILIMYFYGATVNHTLQLANHEISHNLVFESTNLNMLLGIFANIATGVPSSVTFRYYHMDHHQYQGVHITDTDIPTSWEVSFFKTKIRKFIWVVGQAAAYAFRPLMTNPKAPTKMQILNTICVITVDIIIYYAYGFYALLYLLLSSVVGIGFHPAAGHFIAEHYEFVKGYETYSYYGPLNYLNFNVGFHNEHHDFPKIPWTRLSMVHKIAPEWYDHLPHHTSYVAVIYHYIMDDEIGPWSRVKRQSCARLQGRPKND